MEDNSDWICLNQKKLEVLVEIEADKEGLVEVEVLIEEVEEAVEDLVIGGEEEVEEVEEELHLIQTKEQ
jgi:hypothetical protein